MNMENKHRNKIKEELEKGEPFYFIKDGNVLFIGVSCNYDKTNDEHIIWECVVIKEEGNLFKIKRKKNATTNK